MDNFDFEHDSNGNGGLSNGDLGLPSHNETIENHVQVADVVSSSVNSSHGISGMVSAGSNSFTMAVGGVNPRDVMSPIGSTVGMTTKTYSNSITAPSNTMVQQHMPVSTMGMPTPATPHLSAEQNLKRSSEQTPQNGGMLSSLANSMPASFGYSVQSTMANPLLHRNNPNTGIVGSNMQHMNMMNKIQMQNMNFPPGQNSRFANANTMQMFGPGTMRMPSGPNQMSVNPALLKMQPFQTDIRHMGMNGPVGIQNNIMKNFQMSNTQMMAQVRRRFAQFCFCLLLLYSCCCFLLTSCILRFFLCSKQLDFMKLVTAYVILLFLIISCGICQILIPQVVFS